MVMQIDVDPNKAFQSKLNEAVSKLSDLTIPFKLMTNEWFKGNRSMFTLKSRGKFADLSPKYKKIKQKLMGNPYPILLGQTGKLRDSMTNPSSSDSVNFIINKVTLVLGTQVVSKKGSPYGIYLQSGTRNMPARPFVLIGGEQTATTEINNRKEAWINRLNDYAIQVSKGFAK